MDFMRRGEDNVFMDVSYLPDGEFAPSGGALGAPHYDVQRVFSSGV
jgi:hypothetical protein